MASHLLKIKPQFLNVICKAEDLTSAYFSYLIAYHSPALTPPLPCWPFAAVQTYQAHYQGPQVLSTDYFLCLEYSPNHHISHFLTSFIYLAYYSSDRPFLTILSKIRSLCPWSVLVFLSCFNSLHITYCSLELYYIITCLFIICVP